ncbi:MAG: 30S ribosomal protein S16 [Bacilli bacterium]|nr:30S ribosomal protein S16 [Bacilli bacterium]
MAVKIRLTRMGSKKRPVYRIVATDSRRPRDGKYLELIGTYDPKTNPRTVKVNEELAMKWLKTGATPSDTVRSIFSEVGIMKKFAEEKNKKESN